MVQKDHFLEIANRKLPELNESDKRIFYYVLKNIERVKSMSIRQLAAECYVSSSTIFRFVKKLQFDGYSDFVNSLSMSDKTKALPKVIQQLDYKGEYLKNITESIRVSSEENMKAVNRLLDKNPTIYLIGEALDLQALYYVNWLFSAYHFQTVLLSQAICPKNAVLHMRDEDVLFAFAYSGKDPLVVEVIEQVRKNSLAKVVTFTRADNNLIQNLCDIDFYIFTDETHLDEQDITSRVSMIAITELILYLRTAEN
ncbi:MurR/RpiR family transcriptional regulator [Listeria costaricensis]|uniref:MurR/RpiR family transcriptional regulator n=1 Tax=Listeria costaricensis TaxID=2026604 RepID=UPI000C088473|nr:MurR/RpiR family transcriptional regulator [Listeria costaricensis]